MPKRFLTPLGRIERTLIHKFGTRGVLLWHLSFPWIILGIGFILVPQERFSAPGPGGPLEFLDNSPWIGLMWIIGGVCAISSSLIRLRTRDDALGYNGITLPPFIMGICYFWSWITHQTTGGELGRPNSWIASLLYLSFAMLMVFLARNLKDEPGTPTAWRY